VLFAVGTTKQLNPTIDDAFIAAELERDPMGNSAEYLSIERTDRESFLDAALVDGLIRHTPRELRCIELCHCVRGAQDPEGTNRLEIFKLEPDLTRPIGDIQLHRRRAD